MAFQTVCEGEIWCLCTVTFGPKSIKLNSRPVYCSQLYGNTHELVQEAKHCRAIGWNIIKTKRSQRVLKLNSLILTHFPMGDITWYTTIIVIKKFLSLELGKIIMFSKILINLIKCLLRPKIEHSWRYCGWRHRRWSVLYSSQDINQIKDFGSFYCNFSPQKITQIQCKSIITL